MKLCQSTEFISLKLHHLPSLRKDIKKWTIFSTLLRPRFFHHSLIPCKPSFRVLKAWLWLSGLKQLNIRCKHELNKPSSDIVHRLFADCIQCEASFIKLFMQAAFIYQVEVFQDLLSELVAKMITVFFDCGYFRCWFDVILKVGKELICGFDKICRFFVVPVDASRPELVQTLD